MTALSPASAAGYAGATLAATAGQIALLLGPGLVLGLALHAVGALAARRASRGLGRAGYALFGWLGTAVHELGHALFCVLFGHRIVELRLYDPAARDGAAGFVRHAWDRGSLYQRVGNLFIGVGPLLLGTAVIVAAARTLLGPEALPAAPAIPTGAFSAPAGWLRLAAHVAAAAASPLRAILAPGRLAEWRTWLFVYVAFSIGSSLSLSPEDLAGARSGFLALAGILFAANLATRWAGGVPGPVLAAAAGALAVGWAAMLFALVLDVLAALLVLGGAALLGR